MTKRYYYYRAEIDGGDFDGEEYSFCTSPDVFNIDGDTDCEARGYDTEKFREIDIGDGNDTYTLDLVASVGSETPNTTGDTTETAGNATTGTDDFSVSGAGIEVCNDTDYTQSLSFGYEGAEGWTSEGWWVVEPAACVTPSLDGERHPFLYYRAEVDGGDFTGQSYFFCTTPDAYTIVGDSDCEARGYAREDFREVNIGTEGMFTLSLVAENSGATGAPDTGLTPVETAPTTTGPTTGTSTLGDRSSPDVTVEPPTTADPGTGTDTGTDTGTETAPIEEEPVPVIQEPKNPRGGGSRGRG